MSKISNKNNNNTKSNNTKGVSVSTNNVIDNNVLVTDSTYTSSNNYISNTSSNGTLYTTGVTSYTSGDINISTTNSYNIGGIDVEFDRSLTFEEVSLIVGIDINGTKYYHSMIKNGITLYGDLKEKIELALDPNTTKREIEDGDL